MRPAERFARHAPSSRQITSLAALLPLIRYLMPVLKWGECAIDGNFVLSDRIENGREMHRCGCPV
jgi:hypothetical protein